MEKKILSAVNPPKSSEDDKQLIKQLAIKSGKRLTAMCGYELL